MGQRDAVEFWVGEIEKERKIDGAERCGRVSGGRKRERLMGQRDAVGFWVGEREKERKIDGAERCGRVLGGRNREREKD